MVIAMEMTKKYKRKTAIAMYDAGFPMRSIKEELGSDVTVACIRNWSCMKEENKKKHLKQIKRGAAKKRRLKKCKPKIKEQKTKTAKEWKKRVFASWKDTPEQAAIRRSPEYQEWRRIVLERDNYTCQHCEKTGGRLVVHHVKTFKMNPELRMEPDNGIVLCNKCHEELHLSRMKKPKILKFA